jgi:IclR family transcriptional regulator, pca regulon regulatory protein
MSSNLVGCVTGRSAGASLHWLTQPSCSIKIATANLSSQSELGRQSFMPSTPDKNAVHSLAKGFRVLEAFTAERTEMGLAEVARAASIDNATAFRFLNTLVQLGYVEKIPETKRFRLTLKCIDLGFNAIARTDLREFARPLLRELLNDTIEAASIAVPDGPDLVYVERVQAGLVRLGVDVRIGSRVPAYSTAIGHAVLAHLPRETQIRLLEVAPRRRLTSTTLTGLDALLARVGSGSE